MTIDREEFETWRVNPVTRWIFAGIEKAREQEKAEWLRISWDSAPADGKTSPAALIELRTRYDALGELIDNSFENWSEWNGEQPNSDDRD